MIVQLLCYCCATRD